MRLADRNIYKPPLDPTTLYVLLALVDSDRHGYGILNRVWNLSRSAVQLKTGNLYPLLERLVRARLIEGAGARPTRHSELPRKHYTLTKMGMILLKAELQRMQYVVAVGESEGLFGDKVPLDIQALLVEQGLEAGKLVAAHELEAGTAAGRDPGEFVVEAGAVHEAGRVAAADD